MCDAVKRLAVCAALALWCGEARAGDYELQKPGEIRKPGEIQVPKGDWQKPGEIQVPRGTWQVPGEIQKPGEIQVIRDRCEKRLRIGADTLFEFDRAELGPNADAALSGLGKEIEGQGKLRVEGHTDSKGGDDYNQKLSESRARAVQGWLLAHGYDAARVSVQGFGESKPVAPNSHPDGSDDPEGRSKNRRVEVVLETCRRVEPEH